MKITDIPKELEKEVEFACRVCRVKFASEIGKKVKCAWRGCANEICDNIEKVIKERQNEQPQDKSIS